MPCTSPSEFELDNLAVEIAKRAQSTELHDLADEIAKRAKTKFSGRVYQDVRNAFLAVDTNGDGKLTQSEALAFCQHFDLSSEIASRLFTLLDHNETGLADWSSFLAK